MYKAPFSLSRFYPGSPWLKTSRYTVVNRGTIPTKMIDRVLTVTVFPRCSPGPGPGSIMVQAGVSRFYNGSNPVASRFTPVAHRFTPVASRFRHGYVPEFAGIIRGQILKAGSPQWRPGSPRWSPGSPRCRSGYPRFAPDHLGLSRSIPGAITVSPRFKPVSTSLPVRPGSPRFY